MARSKDWNIYEAAILFDALLAVREGRVTRGMAVKNVSSDLRSMAIHNGIEIDEVYRNENGVSAQMSNLSYAFSGKEASKPVSRLFSEIITIYHTAPDRFVSILNEAKAMIQTPKSKEEQFRGWLATNNPTCSWESIAANLLIAEDYCTKKLIIKSPIFDTTDVQIIRKVLGAVEADKIFRVTYKSKKNDILKAVSLYYKYVKVLNATRCEADIQSTSSVDLSCEAPREAHTEFRRAVTSNESQYTIEQIEGNVMTESIQVGKFTLESLTTGMYNDPESCFREYIQNAVDSIDLAVEQGLLRTEDSRIEIIIDDGQKTISVKDNGTGISSAIAKSTLLNIGNSAKLHTVNRGFRGIGRLGGLSYCKKLSFCTTANGEETKTVVTFDCERLRELLVPGQGAEHTLQTVIEAVTSVSVSDEQMSAHYFIVKMEGVDDISSLLDIDLVKDYVSQVAPVPFRKNFYWSNTIKVELQAKGLHIEEYPIFIGKSFERLSQIHKPYKTSHAVSSRADVSKEDINGISFFDVRSEDGEALAYGWYADTDFSGTLAEESVSGIRVRLGNILIGDSKTLSPYFKEPRFNGWVLGEVYVVSQNLIPNARRDNFERNDTFSSFEKGIRSTVGSDASDKIRAASKARNNPSAKAIKKVEKEIAKTEYVLTTGFNSSFEKEQVASNLASAQKELRAIPRSVSQEIDEKKQELLRILDSLEDAVSESKNFKAKKDVTSEFSKDEKKIIQAMLEVLTRSFSRETVDSIYKEFIEEIKSKGKR